MGAPLDDPERAQRLVALVLDWWGGVRAERDALPWRSTRDPWAVLVAETMLAQTQVRRVAERYPAFLERFPTPRACATAPLGELLRAWSGLGYNRRAAQLREAAQAILGRHGGAVPGGLAELLALPGVGPYTARAVRAFALGEDEAVLDTNVGRVLARALAGRPLGRAEAQASADALVPPGGARRWSLALMDFGSLCCSARAPSCASCPLGRDRVCAWRTLGTPEDPARGSAGVTTRQARFAGSDREGRGRLVRAACGGPIPPGALPALAGWPEDPERAARVAADLVAEGLLAVRADGSLVLP